MSIRYSGPTLRLLRQMLLEPKREFSGYELTQICKIGSGTLYPLLARLERASFIVGSWEAIDASEAGRPRRRYYRLTKLGQSEASIELNKYAAPQGALAWKS